MATEAVGLSRRLAIRIDRARRSKVLPLALHQPGHPAPSGGGPPEALEAATEAVGLYGELSAREPAYRDPLAAAWINLGGDPNAVGRSEDALETSSRAVAIRRELAAADDAVLPILGEPWRISLCIRTHLV